MRRKLNGRLTDFGFTPGSTCSIEFWGAAVGISAGVGAAIGGAAIAAGGTIIGSEIQGSAAKSAAQTQANAAENATQAELSMFNTTQQNLAPYMGSGVNALNALNFGLGIGPKTGGSSGVGYGSLTAPFTAAQYQQSPGYAWQMSQGIDAVQNSASAAGGIGGGNTLKALTTFGQGLANTDYQQAYQNYIAQQQQRYNMLSGVANSGQSAAANLGGFSTQVGSQIGSNIIGAGNALAAGTLGQAGAYSSGLNSLTQLASLYGNASNPNNFNNPNNPNGVGGQMVTYYTAGGQPYSATVASGGAGPAYCDYGLKKNIEPYYFDGMARLQVYEFHHKGQDDRDEKSLGYIAQEVAKKYPQAVSRGPRGFLMVDYSKIPSEEDWQNLSIVEDGVFA
jgi:hypothetical protein